VALISQKGQPLFLFVNKQQLALYPDEPYPT